MKDEKELDDLLEESIQAIENGQAPESVAAGLPEDAAELASLLHLAAAVRGVPHPLPSAESKRITQARLAAVAKQVHSKNTTRTGFQGVWAFGLAGLVVSTLCMLALFIGGGLWWYGPVAAHAATVADVSGNVEIGSANGATWHAAANGEQVQSGARIRTGLDGDVTLAFFEGSRASLGPGTEMNFSQVSGQWGDVLQVILNQQSGSARYNIVPLHTGGQFVVNTPSGSTSVHGTVFAVTVDSQGQALVSVDRGKVVVDNAGQQVAVDAGQSTRSTPGAAPQAAAFQFASNNTLTKINGATWSLSGTNVAVTSETAIIGNPQAGQPVFVKGRILNGQWVADLVATSSAAGAEFQLTGIVQSIAAKSWNIDGITILVDQGTSAAEGIKAGDTVLVVYSSPDENHPLASKIVRLDDASQNTPAVCTGVDPQPKGQVLAEKYGLPYADIMDWFCQGFGFGEIDLAYGLSHDTTTPVTDIFALRQQGLGWGEIERRLQVTPTSGVTPAITETSTSDLNGTPTAPEGSPTETTTPDEALTATPLGTQTADCTGANPQPKGQSLAAQYGVSYEEIMGWFCKGFGFGEIDLAYGLSLESGKSVSDIFALRESGLGWGQIKQMLEQEKTPPGKDKDKGKDKGHNKP